jgi:hypothetical protein
MIDWIEYSAVSNWCNPLSVRKSRIAPFRTAVRRYGEGIGVFPV